MEARKNPEYLRPLLDAVSEFRAALVDFLALHEENRQVARGIAPAIFPREDADPEEIERLRAKVSRLAGRAASALPLTGGRFSVQGAGVVDPFLNWYTIAQPKPVLEPNNVLDACDQVAGRLEDLILQAEAGAPPRIGAEAMHPIVWGAAKALWSDGHFRNAVSSAAEALAVNVKHRVGRNDVAETSLWRETFSSDDPKPGKPRLRWPGDPTDLTVKSMNEGLRSFAPGVQMTIRNSATHELDDLEEQAALERLAALSLLARWLDECDLVEAPV